MRALALLLLIASSASGATSFRKQLQRTEFTPKGNAVGRVNGRPCSNDPQCVSHFCTDGYCCNVSCSGSCGACSVSAGADVDGTCKLVADNVQGSPSCTPLTCDGSSASCPVSCATSADCVANYVCDTGACVADHSFSLLTAAITLSDECTGAFPVGAAVGGSVVFTRANSSYCQKSDGTLVLLTNNQPKIEAGGFIQDNYGTQNITYTQRFDQWTCTNATVTTNTHAAPDGTTTADTITTTSAGGFCDSNGVHMAQFTAASMFVRSVTGTQAAALSIYDTDASAARCTSSFTATTAWPLQMSRQYCKTTTVVGANLTHVRIYPGGLAGSGSVVAWGGNQWDWMDALAAYVPADASAVAVNIPTLSWVPAINLSAVGCVSGQVTGGTTSNSISNQALISSSDGDMMIVSGLTMTRIYDSSANIASSPNGTSIAGRTATWRGTWGGSTKFAYLDGVAGSSNTFDGTWGNNGATIYFAGLPNGSGRPPFAIKNILVGTSKVGCVQ